MAVQASGHKRKDMLRHALLLPFATAALLVPAPLALVAAHAQEAARQTVPGLDAVSRRFFADVQRAGEQVAADALARWITASRADAVAAGVTPIPADVRARLQGHVPEALLDKVRYRVGTGHEFSLQTNAFQVGQAAAITLDDVVLFRSAEDAERNVDLWAHELHHVRQYELWGVPGFARRYTRDHRLVEAEAYEEAARIGSAMAATVSHTSPAAP